MNQLVKIVGEVASKKMTALAVVTEAIDRLKERDRRIGAVTRLLEDEALADAQALDAMIQNQTETKLQ